MEALRDEQAAKQQAAPPVTPVPPVQPIPPEGPPPGYTAQPAPAYPGAETAPAYPPGGDQQQPSGTLVAQPAQPQTGVFRAGLHQVVVLDHRRGRGGRRRRHRRRPQQRDEQARLSCGRDQLRPMNLLGRWRPRATSGLAIGTALLALDVHRWLSDQGVAHPGDGQRGGQHLRARPSHAARDLRRTPPRAFRWTPPFRPGPITVGLYVPSSTTGVQTVTAQAVGTTCGNGYSGTPRSTSGRPGATVSGTITMLDARTCPSGTGGTGTGGGGNRPASRPRQPPVGTPPQLACCIEYDQDDAGELQHCGRLRHRDRRRGLLARWQDPGHRRRDRGQQRQGLVVRRPHAHRPGTVLASDGWLSLAFSADGTAPGRAGDRRRRSLEHQQLDPQ